MGLFYFLGSIGPVFFVFWLITVIATIVLATKKGYSGLLAFLLGLFIPLLGSLIIIALLPNKIESEAETSGIPNSQIKNDAFNIPVAGSYTVNQEMNLFKEPNNYDKVLETLNIGDKVGYIKTGSTVSLAGKDAPMFNVKTKNNNIGWCFSGFLDKI